MTTYGLICTFGFAALLAAVSVQCSEIIEQMTDDEVASLFHTTRDKIPEYDVVSVRHNRHRRSNQSVRLQFNAFGKEIDTYLHPSDGQLVGSNTPIWLASTQPNGTIEYKKMREGIVGLVVSSFLANSTDLSAVVVGHAKGENPSFNGIVNGLLIRPLPVSLQKEMRSKRSSEAPNASRTMLDGDYHVIIKSTSITAQKKIGLLERQIREASRFNNRTDASRVKRSDKEVIFPSLLIQTDFKGTKTRHNDLDYYEEIIYQLAFWNGVDLRYRHVSDPKIRIRIAGIIIGQDKTATPYLHNWRSGDTVTLDQGWSGMREYWYQMTQREDFPSEAFDIVVTMTDSDMYYNGNQVEGLADKSSCFPVWGNSVLALAIVHDNGGFGGVLTAAHELGHVLGMNHDSKSGDECDISNGFIMQPTLTPGPKNLEWSPCSLKSLWYFLRDKYMTCYDEPAKFYPLGDPVERLLPGDVWGPHKQCQGRGYAWACEPSPDMCTQMQCYHTHWKAFWIGFWCADAGPAAEGTLCAPGRKCIDGVCQCMTVDCIYTNTES